RRQHAVRQHRGALPAQPPDAAGQALFRAGGRRAPARHEIREVSPRHEGRPADSGNSVAGSDVSLRRSRGRGGAEVGAGGPRPDHQTDGDRRQRERLSRAELPAVVHRRAARGGREDGPPAVGDPAVRGEEPADGRGLSGAHRKGWITKDTKEGEGNEGTLRYSAATRSSSFRSSTTNPSFSVLTTSSLFQRLMMRMQVSIVVPVMSASSWRDSVSGMNVPPRSARPISEASFSKRRAKRDSMRPPVSSARRLVSSTSRVVRPSSRPRTSDGCASSRRKNTGRGMITQVVSSSADALAGNGRSM